MRLRLVLLLLTTLAPASAQAQPELRWPERHTRVHPASYIAQTSGVAAALIIDQAYQPPPDALFRGSWFFDGDLRDALLTGTRDEREAAAAVSDALLLGMLAWQVIDSLVVAGLVRGSSDVAWQILSISTEVIAADFISSTIIKLLIDRERPHGGRCTVEDRVERPGRCGRRGRTRSFYSGHASAAWSYAGTICMHHANVPLYDDEGADAFACGAAVMSASIIGVLRVLADRHWATDVLIGSVVGLATGLFLPYVLHYGWDRSETDGVDFVAAPVSEAPAMFSFGGSF